ncbi:MAG: Clp protease N-terminal domain-containing protein, partial [Candidatus Levyibacteriota bacterium]
MFGNLLSTKKEDQERLTSVSGQSLFGSHVVGGMPPLQQPPLGQVPVSGVQLQNSAGQPSQNEGMDPQKRQNLFALSKLDPRALQVLQHAQEETKRIATEHIDPEQLLLGLFYDGEIFRVLEGFNVNVAKLTQEIQSKEKQGNFSGMPTMGTGVIKIFEEAYGNAKNRAASFVSPEDILIALFTEGATADFLKTFGVEKRELEEKLSKTTGYTSSKKSVLEKYGIDMTQEAKDGTLDPVAGRERETERLIHILLRRTKNNPIIIGEAGVGKTAVV